MTEEMFLQRVEAGRTPGDVSGTTPPPQGEWGLPTRTSTLGGGDYISLYPPPVVVG